MQIAIADLNGKVSLWCYHYGMDEDGFIKFHVINGAWEGKFKDNTVYVEYNARTFPGMLVWAGAAGPQEHGNGKWSKFPDSYYNEAIAWIQAQIDSPEYTMIPYEQIGNYKPKSYEEISEENGWDYDDVPF